MLYEIIDENRQFANFDNILLEHEKVYSREEFRDLVRKAKYSIEEFIEEEYDDCNETMVDIVDTWEDYSSLIAIGDWLCEYKGFSRWIPKEKISVHYDE